MSHAILALCLVGLLIPAVLGAVTVDLGGAASGPKATCTEGTRHADNLAGAASDDAARLEVVRVTGPLREGCLRPLAAAPTAV